MGAPWRKKRRLTHGLQQTSHPSYSNFQGFNIPIDSSHQAEVQNILQCVTHIETMRHI